MTAIDDQMYPTIIGDILPSFKVDKIIIKNFTLTLINP